MPILVVMYTYTKILPEEFDLTVYSGVVRNYIYLSKWQVIMQSISRAFSNL